MPRSRLLLTSLVLLVSLTLNFRWRPGGETPDEETATEAADGELLDHPMWNNIMDDGLPLMVVMGDYYIFGEQNEEGRITRMIRDFRINSPDDLVARETQGTDTGGPSYVDLSMTYMPKGSASALAMVAPVAERTGKLVEVRMISQLSASDLRTHHIVYIGYISGLGLLEPLYFAASGLQVGESYDELYHAAGRELFTSNAARAGAGETLRDLALMATVPAVNDNQIIIIAGTRDPGLREAARIATDPARLLDIDTSLSLTPRRTMASHEALFRVSGTGGMISDMELLYSGTLDPTRLWSRQID